MNFDFQSYGITRDQFAELISTTDSLLLQTLYAEARAARNRVYGNKVFMRGLVEISSYCKNNCLYCGLRRDNGLAVRYRLEPLQILQCCDKGYALGFRTFVLQGGEDPWFTDERLIPIVQELHRRHPDCAITLSLGERSYESYKALREAGAERYLLRHETANENHYAQLHPVEMSFSHRMQCLSHLKALGYQVGCGFMVGSPGQTISTLYEDIQFVHHFQPAMVGIGPFIPASGTPLEQYLYDASVPESIANTVDVTLRLLAIIRLLHPRVLLPATTALATLHPQGREMGLQSGANVVMPNLSPIESRSKYSIYNNKASLGNEGAEAAEATRRQLGKIGFDASPDRGDMV